MPAPEPLGVFGGTFDPVHSGHLRLAEDARETLGLAAVRWIPAGRPAHRDAPGENSAHRLAMVRLALAGNPHFSVDTAEVDSNAPSYTVPTLERLRRELGAERPLVLLLGADAFAGLSTWHRWRDIFDLAHLGLALRPGFVLDAAGLPDPLAAELARRDAAAAALRCAAAGRIVRFTMTQLAISATAIRALLAAGRSARYLLPDAVVDYIDRHSLYRRP